MPKRLESSYKTRHRWTEVEARAALEHLPIERQCTRFARAGVPVPPQTLGRAVAAGLDLLAPIGKAIADQTRAPGLLGTDGTGVPILDPEVPDGIRNGVMWCWTNACWVTFAYTPIGDTDSVRRFLGKDLARTVQCDGTSVTNFHRARRWQATRLLGARTSSTGRSRERG